MSVNASSDKEYISIITLFWSLGNYTLYWYESDTFFFFSSDHFSPFGRRMFASFLTHLHDTIPTPFLML